MRTITIKNKWTDRVAYFEYEETGLTAQQEGKLVYQKILQSSVILGCAVDDLMRIYDYVGEIKNKLA